MPTCIHNLPTRNMHMQHAVMHAQYACAKCMCTIHSPQTVQRSKFMNEPTRGFPSIMCFCMEKSEDFEVAEKPSLPGNKCKRQMGESLPSCQGPWGMLHQISRLYRQVWQFPMAMCSNRLGKVMWLSVVCPTYNTLGLMWSI